MTKKKLNKKVIFTANLNGLSKADELKKITAYGQAVKDNTVLVPDILPVATELLSKVAIINTKIIAHTNLTKQLTSATEELNNLQQEVKNIVVDQWLPYVQENLSNDIEGAMELGFGVKGQSTTVETKGKADESHPVIIRIDMNVQLQHTLHIVNSETSLPTRPDDAEYLAVYRQIGGVAPIDIANLKEAGIAKRGKYASKFNAEDKGKSVFYILAYISKKTLEPLEMSPVYSAIIN